MHDDAKSTVPLRLICKHCGQPARREQRGAHYFLVCGNPDCGAVHKMRDEQARDIADSAPAE